MTERDGETEKKILEAAHRVFMRRGLSGARTQEIAEEAGVNKALLHYYFRNKERLALAVFRRAIGQVLPRVYRILEGDGSLEAKVREVIEVEMDFLEVHPYVPGYVIAEVNYHPGLVQQVMDERGRPPLDGLRAQLKEEMAAGRIRPISAEQFMANLMSLILFPFAARPILQLMLGHDAEWFGGFLRERRGMLADFIMGGLRP